MLVSLENCNNCQGCYELSYLCVSYCRGDLVLSVVLMLPKHRSECDLEQPFKKAYFESEFGGKSIGEPKWKPHIRNALDHPDCQEHSIK